MPFILIPSNVFEVDQLKLSMNVTLLSSHLKCVVFNPTHTHNASCQYLILWRPAITVAAVLTCLPPPWFYRLPHRETLPAAHFLHLAELHEVMKKGYIVMATILVYLDLYAYHSQSSWGKICPCSGNWWRLYHHLKSKMRCTHLTKT